MATTPTPAAASGWVRVRRIRSTFGSGSDFSAPRRSGALAFADPGSIRTFFCPGSGRSRTRRPRSALIDQQRIAAGDRGGDHRGFDRLPGSPSGHRCGCGSAKDLLGNAGSACPSHPEFSLTNHLPDGCGFPGRPPNASVENQRRPPGRSRLRWWRVMLRRSQPAKRPPSGGACSGFSGGAKRPRSVDPDGSSTERLAGPLGPSSPPSASLWRLPRGCGSRPTGWR